MRKALAAVLLLSSSVQALAADVSATSKVESVTVFLSGAEVLRIGRVKLEKGEHVVTVADLPAGAVPGSIRVEGKATGKLDITSVDTRRAYVPSAVAAEIDGERKKIEDQLLAVRDQRALAEAELNGAEVQKTLVANLAALPNRPSPPGGDANVNEDWPRILGLIAAGSAEAAKSAGAAQVKLRELDKQIQDLEGKLAQLAPPTTEQTEVKVFVNAQTPLEADLSIRYQVQDAYWLPVYDARLTSGSKTAAPVLDFTRRAEVRQHTGEAWQDVTLQLSTTRPASGASAPELDTQTVDFERPMPVAAAPATRRMKQSRDDSDGMAGLAEAMPQDSLAAGAPPPPPSPVVVEEQKAALTSAPFQAIFVVPGRLSVPSTNEAKKVTLAKDTIEPKLAVRTVPKSDPSAYLYAKFVLPKGSPTLPGSVILFRDGTFVGGGQIPLLSPGEDHEIGFGVDDQVRVRHAVINEQRGETGLISSSRTDSRNYRITVKNLHERPIDLIVFDQVPVSLNQEIKVEYTGRDQPTNTDVDNKRGVMTFEDTLDQDEERVLEVGYRIAWPAAKSIEFNR